MPTKPTAVYKLLRRPERPISFILKKLDEHRQVLSVVKQALPPFIGEHCIDCLTKGEKLILFTDSPAWATQIRFYQPAILGRLKRCGNSRFKQIHIRVFLVSAKTSAPPKTPRPPSQETLKQLKHSAQGAPSQELKKSLQQLVEALERRFYRVSRMD